MSAWVVSDDHVRLLAQALRIKGLAGEDELDDVCTMLLAENIASVNYHYNETERPYRVKYRPVFYGEDPAAFRAVVLKSAHCYNYQACEHPGWEVSLARVTVTALHDAFAPVPWGEGGDDCGEPTVPGYDKAPWGFPVTAVP